MTAFDIRSDGEEGTERQRKWGGRRAERRGEADTMSNADLYHDAPPPYAESVADTESTIDAEFGIGGASYTESTTGTDDEMKATSYTPAYTESTTGSDATIGHEQSKGATSYPTLGAQDPEEQQDIALASIKRCSILPNRPAVWLVKHTNTSLSPLAATVLVRRGIISKKDLELISRSTSRDPNNPFSGIAFAAYDTVSEILQGLVCGPVEAAKQMEPMLAKQQEDKIEGSTPFANVRFSVRQESSPYLHTGEMDTVSTEPSQASWKPPQTEANPSSWEPRVWSEGVAVPSRHVQNLEACPNAAKEIAVSTGKGLGRIIGAGLKAPMVLTHGVTRGFHNLPKLYGDEVREYENVTGIKSGLGVSAKSFGLGLTDGLKDFFVQPFIGAKKEGGKGFMKGFGKGIGNLACKPAAGAVGLVSYSFLGVYKELQGLGPKEKHDLVAYEALGEAEYNQSSDQMQLDVARRWCQLMCEGCSL